MTRCEKALVIFLRIGGVILLTAIFTAVMPQSWMAAVHRGLGMGELPDRPIVAYLTRSCSGLYAFKGALLMFLSYDVRRYRPLLGWMAFLIVVFGAGLIVLDWWAGLPVFWTLGEGPIVICIGLVLGWLTARLGAGARGIPTTNMAG